MKTITNSIIAGISATIVLTVMMFLKGMMGLMPELDIIHMLAEMLGTALIVGWIMHFIIGAGYGIAFHIIKNILPGESFMIKGVVLGILGWLGMMLMIMPMVGAGVFGVNLGLMAPIMTLMMHIVFGAVLGLVYKKLA